MTTNPGYPYYIDPRSRTTPDIDASSRQTDVDGSSPDAPAPSRGNDDYGTSSTNRSTSGETTTAGLSPDADGGPLV